MSGFEIPALLLLPRGTVALVAGKEDDLPVLRDLPEERHGAPGARIVEIHERVIEHERARIVRRARQLAQRQPHGQVQQIRRPRREIGRVARRRVIGAARLGRQVAREHELVVAAAGEVVHVVGRLLRKLRGKAALQLGIGSNAGVYSSDGGPFYVMRDFFGALTPSLAKANMGDGYPQMVLTVVTMFVGLFLIVLFAHKKVKGSVLLGMLCASGIYWAGEAIFLHTNPFAALKGASFVPAFGDMAATTLFKFDFAALGEIGWFTVVTLVITFCIIDMFDTIGTLVGTASRAGMVDKDGNMPRMREALLADAVGTVTGACTGTSTVTTFVESASGVEAGGRTGLTALTTGLLFLASMFLAPIAAIIPAAATSSALIYVGLLMLGGLKKIDFDDIYQSLPVAIMLISMPVSGSIGHGIGLGMISYSVLKLCTGKGKDVSLLTYAISLLFLVKFFLVA